MSEPYEVAKVCTAAETYFQRDKFPLMLLNAGELGIELGEDSSDEESEGYDSSDDEYAERERRRRKKKKLTHTRGHNPDRKSSSSKSGKFNGPKEEVEGLIKQLNSMSLDDPNYGHTYYKAISMDKNASRCIHHEPIMMTRTMPPATRTLPPASRMLPPGSHFMPQAPRSPPRSYPINNNSPYPIRDDRMCYGCNQTGHVMTACPAMLELMKAGIVQFESPESRRFVLPNGSRIYRNPGESMAQAAERVSPPKAHYLTMRHNARSHNLDTSESHNYYYSNSEDTDEDDSVDESDSSEDDFSIYAIPPPNSDDEYPPRLVRVMPAERTLKKSAMARKEVFDGVHVPPVNRGFNRGRNKENLRPYSTLPNAPQKPATRSQNMPSTLPVKNPPALPNLERAQPEEEMVPEPIPIDAWKVRFDPAKADDITKKPSGAPDGNRRVAQKPIEFPKRGNPDLDKPQEHPRSVPDNHGQGIVSKGRSLGRQSELSTQTESQQVIRNILDVPVVMPLRDLLGSSKEICSGIQDVIRVKNTKPAITVTSREEPTVLGSTFSSRTRGILIRFSVELEGKPIVAIMDTGSQLNVVSEVTAQRLIKKPIDLSKGVSMNDANGGEGYLKGLVSNVALSCGGVHTKANLYVGENVPFDLLLGRPWQRGNFVSIDERAQGTYLLFKNPESLETRFEFLVTPENSPDHWNRVDHIQAYSIALDESETHLARDGANESHTSDCTQAITSQLYEIELAEESQPEDAPKEIEQPRESQGIIQAALTREVTNADVTLSDLGKVLTQFVTFLILSTLLNATSLTEWVKWIILRLYGFSHLLQDAYKEDVEGPDNPSGIPLHP